MFLLSITATFIAVIMVENRWSPCRQQVASAAVRMGRPADYMARFYAILFVYLVFFVISVRILYSFTAVLTFFTVFLLISWAKIRFINEPLVFTDIALLPLLLHHRELFHANWLGALFWLGAVSYVFGISALFFIYEDTLHPDGHWRTGTALMLFLMTLSSILLLYKPSGGMQAATSVASRLLNGSNPQTATARFGPFTYVFLHFLEWVGYPRHMDPAIASTRRQAITAFQQIALAKTPPIVLVWQCESFVDMRRHGVSDLRLPSFDRLRAEACRHGLLDSVFAGGYTLRTEFSVLTGLATDELGPDQYHPYLAAGAYASSAWPLLFGQAGMKTCFLHPYDSKFFSRHKALPALGFQTLNMHEAFEHDIAAGPYVSDTVLAKKALEICRQETGQGLFIFCATIENHGPWKEGRIEGAVGAKDIYLQLLERSDAALEALVRGLDALDRPVWLLFYGDHAPLLPATQPALHDTRTDYFILPAGSLHRFRNNKRQQKREATHAQPWTLIDDLLDCAKTYGAHA